MKRNLTTLLIVMGLAGCADSSTVTNSKQIGENCDEINQCLAGLYCEDGTCRSLCITDKDCSHTQNCMDGRCVAISDGGCRTGWSGANCDSCADNFYGQECDTCPNCGSHGHCDAGLSGTGKCQCDDGWEGEKCDTKSPCREGFTGENCDQCLPGLFGPDCSACTCKNGTCSEGVAGNGHCLDCNSDWAGADCDLANQCVNGVANLGVTGDGKCKSCDATWSGAVCDIPSQCVNGTVNDGIEGNGLCSSCKVTWSGEKCDIESQCEYGDINDGINGDGTCIQCKPGYSGLKCDLPNRCVHGTASLGINGTGLCTECDANWVGEKCDECAANLAGANCTIPNYCQNGTPNLGVDGDGYCVANSCTGGYTDKDCSICDTTKGYGSNCDLYGTMTDKNGLSYKTLVINGKTWMAENMNYSIAGFSHADGNNSNDTAYGLLYTYEGAKKVCPTGWRLPTKEDCEELLEATGSGDESSTSLRSTSWDKGSNSSGFGAVPAGTRWSGGDYDNFGYTAYFWTSTVDADDHHYSLDVDTSSAVVNRAGSLDSYSVRCVKDEE